MIPLIFSYKHLYISYQVDNAFLCPGICISNGYFSMFSWIRKGKRALSKILLTWGIWLIIVEIIIINFAFSFDWRFSVIGLQTIWALGVSMIVLSVLIYLPNQIILALALLIIGLHNALDTINLEGTDLEAFGWSLLHEPKFFPYKPFQIFVLYPVLPWIGVMAAGYCFGQLYTRYDADKRKKLLIILGSVCILLFVVIRFTNMYGDESQWAKQQTPFFIFLSFINASKYPPSLLYILMTIGPAMLFLAFTENLCEH